ncbi:MAG: CHRD domain-containing protein [Bacteroidia bacterium]
MRKITKIMIVVASALLSLNVGAQGLSSRLLVTANLTGAQETPSVATSASGVASFMLNPTQDTMCVSMAFNGLSGAITGVHVHVGTPGVAGGVITNLTPSVTGNQLHAFLTGANLTSAMVANYLAGNYYVNVHTAANPNGEIRGQLNLESDYNYTINANGAQETPSVTTSAYAFGSIHLSQDQTVLTLNLIANGLSGSITGAHLHYGKVGVAGGVAINFSSDVFGNIVSGNVKTTPAFLDSLAIGHVYFNIHTAANPGGEIRGQVLTNTTLSFDAIMQGSNEVPSVTTSAVAIANLQLNTAMDTLWINGVATGLSGKITGLHLHSGAVGVAGGVLENFSTDTSGQRFSGYVAGSANITNAIVQAMLEGLTYVNIHTVANPNGEIRGQVYEYARQGFTITGDGAQETPSVTTNAYGIGSVSIDVAGTSAHYMVAVNNLSGALSAAHFHQGTAGNAGGVLYTIPTFMPAANANSTAVGFWTDSTATTPFTTTIANYFFSGDVYLNAHTAADPNGEMRGQLIFGSQCSSGGLGIAENLIMPESFNVYPNPSNGLFNIALNANQAYSNGFVKVYNLLGQQVFSETVIVLKGQNNYSLDISKLNSGIYMISIQEGSKEVTQRIIKN